MTDAKQPNYGLAQRAACASQERLELCRAHDECDGALCIRDPKLPHVCAVCRSAMDPVQENER